MRRWPGVAATTLILSVLITVPAGAKAFHLHRLTIRGPGLTQPEVLTREQFGIPRNAADPAAVATEGLLGRFPASEAPPQGDLGPRYRLRWELELLSGRVAVLHQDLYPFADAGPHTFTPDGQHVAIDIGTPSSVLRVPPGWLEFPEELVPRLQRYGFPVGSPVRTPSHDDGGLPWWLLPPIIAGLTALGLFRQRARRETF